MDGSNGLEAAERRLARGSRSTAAAGAPASSQDAARLTAGGVLARAARSGYEREREHGVRATAEASPDSAIRLAARERPTPPRCHDQVQ